MSIDYMDAMDELPDVSAEELHLRFFWYRYPGGAR